MRICNLTVPLLVLTMPTALWAVGFNATLESLLESSPALALENAGYEAGIAASRTEANLPDPEVEAERLWGGEEGKWNASIGWTLDWPSLYAAKKKSAAIMESGSQTYAEAKRRALRAELGDVLVRYIAARKKEDVYGRLLNATDSIAVLAQKSRTLGELTSLDESRIAIERGLITARLLSEKQNAEEALSEMTLLCGFGVEGRLGSSCPDFPEDKMTPAAEYVRRAESAPGVLLAELEAAGARQREKIAGAERLPSVSVGYIHAYEEGYHFNGGRLGLSLPIFSGKGKKRAAEADAKVAEMNVDNMRRSIVEQTRIDVRRLDALRSSLAEISPVFTGTGPQELLLKSFELGQITFPAYLQERKYFIEAELDYIELLASRAGLLVSLESL